MTTKTLKAWVLHKQWSGETSAKVTLFTRELGVIHAPYKGARAQKKQALLQAFLPLWIGLDERYDRYFIRSAEANDPGLQFVGDTLFSALYINELIYCAISQGCPDAELYDAYQLTLFSLAKINAREAIESALRRFEWALLRSCGYSFSLTHTSDDEIICAKQHYRYSAGKGFVLEKRGISGECILALAQDNLGDPSYLKAAKLIMRQAIDSLLGGRELKSRSLYLS